MTSSLSLLSPTSSISFSLFSSVQFYLSGQPQPHTISLLVEGGGRQKTYLSGLVTHCIAATQPDSNELSEAEEMLDVPVVTEEWVASSARCGHLLSVKGFSTSTEQLFTGVTLVMDRNTLDKGDCERLWAMITWYGGKVGIDARSGTHIVTGKGGKYPILGRVKLVTPDWVVNSVKGGRRIAVEGYHPDLLVIGKEEENLSLTKIRMWNMKKLTVPHSSLNDYYSFVQEPGKKTQQDFLSQDFEYAEKDTTTANRKDDDMEEEYKINVDFIPSKLRKVEAEESLNSTRLRSVSSKWSETDQFTREEAQTLLHFFLKQGVYFLSGGNEIWKVIEKACICPGHSWQSLKHFFKNHLVQQLPSYGVTEEELKCSGKLREEKGMDIVATYYSMREGNKIVNYIVDHGRFEVKGTKIWKMMEKRTVVVGR